MRKLVVACEACGKIPLNLQSRKCCEPITEERMRPLGPVILEMRDDWCGIRRRFASENVALRCHKAACHRLGFDLLKFCGDDLKSLDA